MIIKNPTIIINGSMNDEDLKTLTNIANALTDNVGPYNKQVTPVDYVYEENKNLTINGINTSILKENRELVIG